MKQISTVEMSPLGDVAVATCSPRHNARRVILKEVSLRPLGDREEVSNTNAGEARATASAGLS